MVNHQGILKVEHALRVLSLPLEEYSLLLALTLSQMDHHLQRCTREREALLTIHSSP